MADILNQVLDVLFPPKCETCGGIGRQSFCLKCSSKVTYLAPSIFFHSVGEYEGVLKKAIKKFKFKNKRRLAQPLGSLMVEYINRHLWKDQLDMVIPVPLHRRRLHQRGFNQAELLALEITEQCHISTVSGLLFRKRDTKAQFGLPRQQRLINIRGAFELRGNKLIKGKNILLVDDIYTTGATSAECTKMLKAAGASSVHILTLSRAV